MIMHCLHLMGFMFGLLSFFLTTRVEGTGQRRVDNHASPPRLSRQTYTAAVYEHKFFNPNDSKIPVSRSEALQNMMINLKAYQTVTAQAKKQGSDIIVFPEYGIYGEPWWTRKTIFPYMEDIPDPQNTSVWNPCNNPSLHQDTEVQTFLSCLAKNNSIYVVANMGDKKQCLPSPFDPNCRADGYQLLNTQVVYSPNGDFIQRYHKFHLADEEFFDSTDKPEVRYFDTPFGRFGLLICYDIIFQHPLLNLVDELGIENLAFSTAWNDKLTIITPIGLHSSVARALKINVLSANGHFIDEKTFGSGIFAPFGEKAFYFNRSESSGSKLLVAKLNILQKRSYKKDYLKPNLIISQNYSKLNSNESFSNLGFTLLPLKDNDDSLKLCQNRVCCELKYSFKKRKPSELFVLAVRDGLLVNSGLNTQMCSVFRCQNDKKDRCLHPEYFSSSSFDLIDLKAQTETAYVFPILLTSRKGQLALSNDWTYLDKQIIANVSEPLHSITLFGRNYKFDNPSQFSG